MGIWVESRFWIHHNLEGTLFNDGVRSRCENNGFEVGGARKRGLTASALLAYRSGLSSGCQQVVAPLSGLVTSRPARCRGYFLLYQDSGESIDSTVSPITLRSGV